VILDEVFVFDVVIWTHLKLHLPASQILKDTHHYSIDFGYNLMLQIDIHPAREEREKNDMYEEIDMNVTETGSTIYSSYYIFVGSL